MTRAGTPTPGWSVKRAGHDGIYPIDCSPPDNGSFVALSDNIYYCLPSAAYAVACWRSTSAAQVLCLQDPWLHELIQARYTGKLGTAHPYRHPSPLGLELTNGDHCYVRDGGAWGQPKGHPDLYGTYACLRGKNNWDTSLWGSDDGNGINRKHNVWTVLEGDESGALATVGVIRAYFVATAG